jgi:membrane-associated phospholipid phosphatase
LSFVATKGEYMTGLAEDHRQVPVRDLGPPAVARHPFRRALAVTAIAYAVLTAAMLGIGFLLTDLLDGSVGRWDEHVNRAFVHQRTGTWNDVTKVATSSLNTEPVVVAVVVLVAVFALLRWWREAAAIAIAMTLEITVFLSTTFAVGRPRPSVPRLNDTPATSSFPSGHTAAATVLFTTIAVIVAWHTERRTVRAVAWIAAALAIVAVAVGRVYRGLHHPTDVIAGVVLGVACVIAALWAVRAAYREAGAAPR